MGAGPSPGAREDLRQAYHALATVPALALAWLDPIWAAALALGGVALGFVLTRVSYGRGLLREDERRLSGVELYPMGVLIAVVAFPLPIAAAGWGALGVGDAASNVVGRRLGRLRLPWNASRTWAGTLAFVVFAALAAGGLLAFTWPNGAPSLLGVGWPAVGRARSLGATVAPALAAAVAGAVVESLPGADDNVTIPVVAAATAWIVLVLT